MTARFVGLEGATQAYGKSPGVRAPGVLSHAKIGGAREECLTAATAAGRRSRDTKTRDSDTCAGGAGQIAVSMDRSVAAHSQAIQTDCVLIDGCFPDCAWA